MWISKLPQGSAFPDLDIYFGSKGSFFDFNPREGSFQLGTPNVEEVMIKAATKVNLLLDSMCSFYYYEVLIM